MKRYKHYSFDLWLTLIRSNPLFKEQRSLIFYQRYNWKRKSLEEVKAVFRQVDIAANAINEATGGNMDAEALYLWVITAMNDYDTACLKEVDIVALYDEMDVLLQAYSPVIYSPQTIDVLHEINQFATISLLSNTGFIKGQSLRNVLRTVNLDQFLQFQLYSDETGLSKPNSQFFTLMLDHVAGLYPGSTILPDDIIHIGDNKNADIKGAQSVGIHSLLVHQPSTTITIASLLS